MNLDHFHTVRGVAADVGGTNQLILKDKAEKAAIQSGQSPKAFTEISPMGGGSESIRLQSSESALTGSGLLSDAYRNGIDSSDLQLASRSLGEAPDQPAPASISVALSGGDASTELISSYSRFFLQAVSEGQAEKFQTVETFTAHYTFFYGKRPSVYNFRGTLLNDEYHRWADDFTYFYENFFRGTRSVEQKAHAVLRYDGKLVRGFITDFVIQQVAEMDRGVSFSLNLLVTDHSRLKPSPDIQSLLTKSKGDLNALRDLLSGKVPADPMTAALRALTKGTSVGRARALTDEPTTYRNVVVA